MTPILRLTEDILPNDTTLILHLPAIPRMIFVVHGSVTIGGKTVGDGDGCDSQTWHGEGETTLTPGETGATCWRFELVRGEAPNPLLGPDVRSLEKISARLDTLPRGELIMRGDSVGFPPGGCAYLHRHQGPGIRCLIDGGIRIDTHGRSTSYGPGGAWYESGPDAVFAQAAADRPSRFIRVMILPRALLGKSSIQYVNEDDKAKPKSQQYRIFVDAPIAFAT